MDTRRYDSGVRWLVTGAVIACLPLVAYYLTLYPSQDGFMFWSYVCWFAVGCLIMIIGALKLAVLRFDQSTPGSEPVTGADWAMWIAGGFIGAVLALLLYLVVR